MDGPEKVKRRTRDGCWTCRKRKKKCDSPRIPCGNCTRLGLECENQVRLVWEDDARRAGMKRRGPTGRSRNGYAKKRQDGFIAYQPQSDSKQVEAQDTAPSEPEARDSLHDLLSTSEQRAPPGQIIRYQQLSPYPRVLDSIDSLLLDNYVQRFSRQYPTCSGPSNPFLSVLIPLAMKCGMVLDSVLALSGAQKWEHGIASMEKGSLRLRQRALAGTRALLFAENDTGNGGGSNMGLARNRSALAKNNNTGSSSQFNSKREENLLYILTSSILFLLYEKVSGEPTWKPHMNFISQFFERWLTSLAIDAKQSSEVAEAVRFLHDIFVYNDLVRSTSLKTKPLSNFYLIATTANVTNCSPLETAFFPSGAKEQADFRRRYYFPNLIARLSSGDLTVTEEAIAAWDGSMDWLPSFALYRSSSDETDFNTGSPIRKIPWDDRSIISELYRTAASIYRRRILISRSSKQVHHASELSDIDQGLPQLASFAHFLMMSLSEESAYENALLWPLGITAKELTLNQVDERRNVILRLQRLESRFQMRHFQSVQDVLLRHWAQRDSGLDPSERSLEEDAILLG